MASHACLQICSYTDHTDTACPDGQVCCDANCAANFSPPKPAAQVACRVLSQPSVIGSLHTRLTTALLLGLHVVANRHLLCLWVGGPAMLDHVIKTYCKMRRCEQRLISHA